MPKNYREFRQWVDENEHKFCQLDVENNCECRQSIEEECEFCQSDAENDHNFFQLDAKNYHKFHQSVVEKNANFINLALKKARISSIGC